MVLRTGHFGEWNKKFLESFEMWCWRKMEKISWTERVKNEEELRTVMEKMYALHTIKRKRC
jgi:hypothetical protein